MEKNVDEENKVIIKKRGRPKKNMSQISIKPTKQHKYQQEYECVQDRNSIPLHIPLYDDTSSDEDCDNNFIEPFYSDCSCSEKNKFTMKDESEFEKKEKTSNMYLSDDDDKNNNKKSTTSINNKMSNSITSNFNLYDNKNLKKITYEKTKLSCWWCTYGFNNLPAFIVEKFNNNNYYVFGNFCSFNCAIAYILKDDEFKIQNRLSLTKKLYYELYDTKENIFPSPQKELLDKYGGPMNIEEYRKIQGEDRDYKIKLDNIIQLSLCFEECNKVSSYK